VSADLLRYAALLLGNQKKWIFRRMIDRGSAYARGYDTTAVDDS
jgi:hypothetical protein